jgi:DNA-binding MarR family transcriptional regulator
MSSTFISRFTPSLMTPDTLEALFIQRGKLAAQVMDDIRHSAAGKAKHYHLLIGQRGLGKTHFVALIYDRLKSDAALAKRLRIAWLREDERGISSFLELLMRILHALAREYPDAGLQERMQALYDQPPKQAERMAQEALTDHLGKRTLLLLMENLDSIFIGLKEAGQQAFRAYLQEKGNCAILATSTALFNGVSLQRSPFYAFFNINHLQELTLEEAIELLAHIAEARQDRELAEFIRNPTGRARIRAIHHLAGGNHRIYVVFSEFLTRESLDELVTPFMRMLDDLTPYYQGRMDLLSPQQQQIVEDLAHAGGAQTVKAIARHCFMTPQTAATQLRTLKERGFLNNHTPKMDKRETYYELREPLMRLCFEVKEYRGGPIRLFVDFLRNWYSREELRLRMDIIPGEAAFTRDCIQEALSLLEQDGEDPRVIACLRDFSDYMTKDDGPHLLQVAEELAAIRGKANDWLIYGLLLMKNHEAGKAISAWDKIIETDESIARRLSIHIFSGTILMGMNHLDEAIERFGKALKSQYENGIDHIKQILIDSIGVLQYKISLPAQREQWLLGWQRIASDREDFQPALAMLAAAVQYLNTGDDRALLELPVEERKLVLKQLAETVAEEGETENTTE